MEEYENNEFAPENSDETIEEAYVAYKRVMEQLNAWGIVVSQIKVYEPTDSTKYSIGLEHYDIYSYAMYFYWLELYFKKIQYTGNDE